MEDRVKKLINDFLHRSLPDNQKKELAELLSDPKNFKLLIDTAVETRCLINSAQRRLLGTVAREQPQKKLIGLIQKIPTLPPTRRNFAFSFAYAAAILLLIGGGILLFRTPKPKGQVIASEGGTLVRNGRKQNIPSGTVINSGDVVCTEKNENIQWTYPEEGTIITVFEESQCRLENNGRHKIVNLIRGKIHADVAEQQPDAKLILFCSNYKFTVLGTSFTLTTDNAFTTLEVFEGRVLTQTQDETRSIVVAAGNYIRLSHRQQDQKLLCFRFNQPPPAVPSVPSKIDPPNPDQRPDPEVLPQKDITDKEKTTVTATFLPKADLYTTGINPNGQNNHHMTKLMVINSDSLNIGPYPYSRAYIKFDLAAFNSPVKKGVLILNLGRPPKETGPFTLTIRQTKHSHWEENISRPEQLPAPFNGPVITTRFKDYNSPQIKIDVTSLLTTGNIITFLIQSNRQITLLSNEHGHTGSPRLNLWPK